ncbi:MAG: adenosine kinase [Rhodospirillaceae bacterium]|jgi:sugar/nucleoside kinase (ribokinase family)|nr:adenosine kinase [Rhodospirillaceae bacterium]
MSDTRFDVLGIGNAIVDILAHAEDEFLATEGLDKGAMALVDSERAGELYAKVGSAVECSGGSAANTIAGLASLGGRAAFIGKVRDDQLGQVFRHDIKAIGVAFDTPAATDGPPTATSLVLVSPDAERTMQTYLGACVDLGPDDIDEDQVAASAITYLEGYLWDPPAAKQAFRKAADVAHAKGRKVSLSLSDPFCVDRHREDFLELVSGHVDILFANEEEIISLYQADEFDAALQAVRGHCDIVALTRGAKGSVVVAGDEVHVVDADPIERLVDTTGAGDAYAAGFLFGLSQEDDLSQCAHIGNIAASEVIQHMGARPDRPLKELVQARLGDA